MINCVIVEDERLARQKLQLYVKNHKGLNLIASYVSAETFLKECIYVNYDLILLDIGLLDYLLKPFDFERFSTAIEKMNSLVSQVNVSVPSSDKIIIKEGKTIHQLRVEDIFYIKGLKEYVVWHTVYGKLITLHSLSYLSDYLSTFGFIQTHKSYIVNKQKVNVVEYWFVHIDKEQIPIGRSYRKQVKEHFSHDL